MLLLVLGGLALYFAGVIRYEQAHLLRLALLLLGAMAAIRLFVYVLRRSLPRAAWIGTFELGIAFTIWFFVALHVTGLLDDLIGHLDSVRFPLGKTALTRGISGPAPSACFDRARSAVGGMVVEAQ